MGDQLDQISFSIRRSCWRTSPPSSPIHLRLAPCVDGAKGRQSRQANLVRGSVLQQSQCRDVTPGNFGALDGICNHDVKRLPGGIPATIINQSFPINLKTPRKERDPIKVDQKSLEIRVKRARACAIRGIGAAVAARFEASQLKASPPIKTSLKMPTPPNCTKLQSSPCLTFETAGTLAVMRPSNCGLFFKPEVRLRS